MKLRLDVVVVSLGSASSRKYGMDNNLFDQVCSEKVQYLTSGNISDVDQRSLHRFHQYLLHVDKSCGKSSLLLHIQFHHYQQKELNNCQDLKSTCQDRSPT